MIGTQRIRIFNTFLVILGWLFAGSALAQASVTDRGVKQPIVIRPSAPNVSVRLPANNSTGFQWILVQYDAALMRKPVSHYVAQSRNIAGAPGYSVWQFKFKKTAFAISKKTVVILEYKRPWEKSAGKQQMICFMIETQ